MPALDEFREILSPDQPLDKMTSFGVGGMVGSRPRAQLASPYAILTARTGSSKRRRRFVFPEFRRRFAS